MVPEKGAPKSKWMEVRAQKVPKNFDEALKQMPPELKERNARDLIPRARICELAVFLVDSCLVSGHYAREGAEDVKMTFRHAFSTEETIASLFRARLKVRRLNIEPPRPHKVPPSKYVKVVRSKTSGKGRDFSPMALHLSRRY
ncbi:MAG TPA: hypothetical protein VJG83_01610 [archaeon]|nr:hypothetical protein [archaeon]